jgi:hypothetical protein
MVTVYRSVLGDVGIDGRTARGRDLLKLKNKLIAYVGGYLSPVQMLWIERALLARQRLYELEDRMHAEVRWTSDDIKTYEIFDASFHKSLSSLARLTPDQGRNPRVLSLFELVGQHKAGELRRNGASVSRER